MAFIPMVLSIGYTPPPTVRFFEIVDIEGKTFLRIRQATELGYTDCPAPGAADLSYPSSALRRSRTVGGGKLVNALTAASSNPFVFVEL